MTEEKKKEVRAILTGEIEKRYDVVKNKLGMEADSDVLRLLITLAYYGTLKCDWIMGASETAKVKAES